ncbi:uncharacterized protein [Antedon mediterranea]|uniref:uncharacterized protein n=1 Tax=Antedon mediterranea TaxID=105859 RepID=UPI003AF6B809
MIYSTSSIAKITRLTGPKDAEHLVRQYITDNNIKCTGENKLKPDRERLFRAVKQSGSPAATRRVTANYRLDPHKSLWDVVFELEKRLILPKELTEFASLLGERAQKEIGLLSTDLDQSKELEANEDDSKKNEKDAAETTSSSKEKIEKYLLARQQMLCQKEYKNLTPSIMNSKDNLDIDVFTKLDLIIENDKTRKNQPTTLPDILTTIESTPGCRVLIEGEAGIGKTTMLRYLAYKTTEKQPIAFKGKIVFLFNVRDFEKDNSIFDVIEEQLDMEDFNLDTGLEENPKLIKQFIKKYDDTMVLLLDGLDELRFENKSLVNLFRGKLLGRSVVLLTSRSEHIDEFIKDCNIHVTVKGFNRYSIGKYIKNHFNYFENPELGHDLIHELQIDQNVSEMQHNELCKNPMFLLSICIIWEDERRLPSNNADLFKEIFRCILNHYIKKNGIQQKKIAIFEKIPEKYVDAMMFLGECMYSSLKKNQLSIEKNDEDDLVKLAFKLGFVCRIPSLLRSDSEPEIYMPTHKSILESLVGFYIYKLCERGDMINECTTDVKKSKYLISAYIFAVEFLGADADKLLQHWVTDNLSTYRPLIHHFLKFVNDKHWGKVKHALIQIPTKVNQYTDVLKSLKACIDYFNSNLAVVGEHFIDRVMQLSILNLNELDLRTFCNTLSVDSRGNVLAHIVYFCTHTLDLHNYNLTGGAMNVMITEWSKMGGELNFNRFIISENNLNGIDAKLLHELMTSVNFYLSFDMIDCNLSGKLMNDISTYCKESMEIFMLNIAKNNLSDVKGTLLGNVFSTIPKLLTLDVHDCALSGHTLNEMICAYKGNELKLQEICIEKNNISGIDGNLLGKFLTRIPGLLKLGMHDCELSGDVMNKMMREYPKSELQVLDIANNDISDIDANLLGSFLSKSPNLSVLDMHYCNLSGEVLNTLMIELNERNELQLQELNIGNKDICDITGGTLLGNFWSTSPKLSIVDLNDFNLSDKTYLQANNAEKIDISKIDGTSIGTFFSKPNKLKMNEIEDHSDKNEMNRVYAKREYRLQQFNIRKNDISNIDSTLLGTVLGKSLKMSKLVMHDCKLTGGIMNEIINRYERDTIELREFYIGNNDISDIDGNLLSTLIMKSPKLQILDLGHCKLSGKIINTMMETYAAKELQLKCLFIDNNDISDIDGILLGNFLSKCPNLSKFLMNDCKISGDVMNKMTRECGKMKLQEIYIGHNDMREVDGSSLGNFLCRAPKLLTLSMSNCRITGHVMNNIIKAYAVDNFKLQLQKLDIGNNDFSKINGTLIGTFLRESVKLLILLMNNCSISGDVMNQIMRAYSGDKLELQVVSISNNDISDINGTLLGTFLSKFPKLLKLDMHDCKLSGHVMNKMMRAYSGDKSDLQLLHIYNNDFSDIDGTLLGTFLSKCPKLPGLYMYDCKLSGNVMNKMMRAYSGDELELQVVSIYNNDISDIDGRLLGTLLSRCQKLLKLSMHDCKLSGNVMNEMMRMYSGDKSDLQLLNIFNNDFSDIDGALLGTFLSNCPKLPGLYMYDCKISGDVMNKMMRAYSGEELELQEVSMYNNDIRDIDGSLLGNFLTKFPKLLKLDMHDCKLSGVVINEMAGVCAAVKFELQEIYIGNNDIRDVNGALLGTYLSTCPKLLILNLFNCNLSGEKVNEIIRVYADTDELQLQLLNIGNNDIHDIDADLLGTYLSRSSNLLKLYMQNCKLTGGVMNEMMRGYSGDELELQELFIYNNDISDIDGRLLGTLLSRCQKLLKLSMHDCKLSGNVMNEMMRAYSRDKSDLQLLNIYNNDFRDIDGALLGTFLSKCPKLPGLHMYDCKISGDVMNKMMRAYSGEELELQVVSIYNNDISDIDGRLLGTLLSRCQKLLKLSMHDCKLSGNVMNEMMRAYSRDKSDLQLLHIYNNDFSDIDGALLGTFLSKCPKLPGLYMYDCKISGDVMNKMMRAYSGEELELQEVSMYNNDIRDIEGSLLGTFLTKFPKLLKLDMHECKLSGNVMNEMMRMYSGDKSDLQLLNIFNNDFSDIDGALLGTFLSKCPKLPYLYMYDCKLSGDVMNKMMRAYSGDELDLQVVSIYNNDIRDIDGSLLGTFITKFPKLLMLDMHDCKLSGNVMNKMMRACLGDELELQVVSIYNNDIRDIDGSLLGNFLTKFPKLLELEMHDCKLSGNVMNEMMRAYSRDTSDLQLLNIYNNDFSDIDGALLGTFLSTCPKLPGLYMYDCKLSGDVMNKMMRTYSGDELELQVISIYNNDIRDIDGTLLGTFLSKFHKLLELYMYDCKLSGDVMNQMMRAYSGDELELQVVSMYNNDIRDIDGSLLGNFLTKFPKLLKLDMHECKLSGNVMNEMMRMYSGDKSDLQLLNIFNNDFSDIDGALLGTFLSKCPKLPGLYMYDCKISGDVMNKMMRAYSGEELELQEVSMYNNDIRDIEGSLLGTFLTKFPKLLKLDMHECKLSGNVMNEMMRMYSGDKSDLQLLNIFNNDFSDIDGALLGTFLSKCPKLPYLYMYDCKLSGDVMNKMMRAYSGDELDLQVVSIYNNDIRDIDGSLLGTFITKFPKLLMLDMHDCKLSGNVMNKMMRACLGDELELQVVSIYNNDIRDIDGSLLGNFLTKFPKLLELEMHDCKLSGNVMNEMMRAYSRDTSDLQLLNIYNNDFSDIDGALLGTFLSTCPKLPGLYMYDCKLSGDVMNKMMRTYSGDELELQVISIYNNDIRDIDGTLLGTFLSKFHKLLELYMYDCKLSGDVMNQMMRAYSGDELELQVVSIYNNDIRDIDGNLLGTFLTKFSKLLKLSMHDCKLSGNVMNEMMRAYSGDSSDLQLLNIYNNDFSDIDGALLGTFLSTCPKLPGLYMYDCKLSGDVMNKMMRTYSGDELELQVISIYNNDIRDIDGALLGTFLTKFPKLLELDMHDCKLSGNVMNKMMRACLGDELELQVVSIYNNDIRDIDGSLLGTFLTKFPKLLMLDMHDCKLSGNVMNKMMRACLGDELELQVVSIYNNDIRDIDGSLLGNFLTKFPKLLELEMHDCKLSGNVMNEMMRAYSRDTSDLQLLHIYNNDFSDIDGALLGTFISKCPKLPGLYMYDCKLSGDVMNQMMRAYSGDELELQVVSIYNNDISDIDGRLLGTLLSRCQKLLKLSMHECKLSGNVMNEMMRMYSGDKSDLQLLNIYNNDFSDIDGALLGTFLSKCPKLPYLYMYDCKLSGEVMNKMMRAYSGDELDLQVVSIYNNDIRDIDGSLLGTFLTKFPKLLMLDMHDCKLSGNVMNKMMRACLGDELELQVVSIYNNDIRDIDGSLLGNFLTKFPKLLELEMHDCKLSGNVMNEMMRAYSRDTSDLQLLHIYNNDFSDIDGALLGTFISKCPKLPGLYMYDCKLSGDVMNQMMRAYSGDELELQVVSIYNNDISDIDGRLLGTLLSRCQKLLKLSMHECKLSGNVMNEMMRMYSGDKSDLQLLNIYNNDFSDIDGALLGTFLSKCPKLPYLYMYDCKLSGEVMNKMMRAYSGDELDLQVVSIYNNDIRDIDGSLLGTFLTKFPKLLMLDMHDCKLSGNVMNKMMRACLGDELELQVVSIYNNDIRDIDGSLLGNFLTKFPKLLELEMHDCKLSGNVMNEMMRAYSRDTSDLQLLHIYNNDFSDIDGALLGTFISKCPKLPGLYMYDCKLSGDVMNQMMGAYSGDELELQVVSIYNNDISDIDGRLLGTLLSRCQKLLKLSMHDCKLSGNVMNEMMRAYSRDKSDLQLLHIYNNDFSDIDGALLGNFLSKCPKLPGLYMYDCKISGDVMNKMMRAYSGEELDLQVISMYNNDIRDIEGSLLGTFLTKFPKLLKLDMHECKLLGNVMNEMMRAYSGYKSDLQLLNIYNNDFSDIDGALLGTFLSKCPKLAGLYMYDCKLSGDVMNKMMRAYSGDELELQVISIYNNDIRDIDGTLLGTFLSKFPKLLKLDMHDCKLTSHVMNEMMRMFSGNTLKLQLQA